MNASGGEDSSQTACSVAQVISLPWTNMSTNGLSGFWATITLKGPFERKKTDSKGMALKWALWGCSHQPARSPWGQGPVCLGKTRGEASTNSESALGREMRRARAPLDHFYLESSLLPTLAPALCRCSASAAQTRPSSSSPLLP